MSAAGVVLDAWKLPVFKRRLDDAGYQYTECPGITPDTKTLRVKYEYLADLMPIIEAANKECAQCQSKRLH